MNLSRSEVQFGSRFLSRPRRSLRIWGNRHCRQVDNFLNYAKMANGMSLEERTLKIARGIIQSSQPEATKRRHFSRERPPTTERGQATHSKLDQEISRPSWSIRAGTQPVPPGVHIPGRLPPPVYNGPDPSNASSSPSGISCISAARTHSDDSSIPRSVIPVTHLVDIRMAERPTVAKALNTRTAQEARGVLGREEKLSAVSHGIGGIITSLYDTLGT